MKTKQIFLANSNDNGCDSDLSLFLPMSGRKDIKPYTLNLPIDWSLDPFDDINWCAQLHMWRMLDRLLIKYEANKNNEILKLCIAVVKDWWIFHQKHGYYPAIAWGDMRAGVRAMKLAFLLIAVRRSSAFSSNDVFILNELVASHAWYLLDEKNVGYSNHTFSHLHGLMALRQVVDDNRGLIIERFVDDHLQELIKRQFNSDYVHKEHSPEYQLYVVGCLRRLLRSGWFGQQYLTTAIEKASEVANWFIMPNGYAAPVGDTNSDLRPSKLFLEKAAQQNGIFCTNACVVVKHRDVQNLRSNHSYLFASCAKYSNVHKHNDDLSIIWYEAEPILVDPGKYAYNRDQWRNYIRSRRAHNVLDIESGGRSINLDPGSYGGGVKEVRKRSDGLFIKMEVSFNNDDIKQRRILFYKSGVFLLVLDEFDLQTPANFTKWYHFSPELECDIFSEFVAIKKRSSMVAKMLQSSDVNTHIALYKGKTEPNIQGWISPTYGEMSQSDALGVSGHDKQGRLASLFLIGGTKGTVKVVDGGEVLFSVEGVINDVVKVSDLNQNSTLLYGVE